jgi:DNA modification methylase
MSQPLAVRTKGKESFFSACNRYDCNGIGRCGYCFGSLTIASLNVKQKDELNIPHLVAMALQADGWVLRQTIIWHKPNPMPESVRDRCTKAHEYIFLLSKSEKYFFDSEAIKEPLAEASIKRGAVKLGGNKGVNYTPEPTDPNFRNGKEQWGRELDFSQGGLRNKRSVWTVATKPYKGAHFATFPTALIEPCILAGSRPGDIVLDCFMGSGTTAAVCLQHGRQYLGCELNPEYGPLQEQRIDAERDLFTEAA